MGEGQQKPGPWSPLAVRMPMAMMTFVLPIIAIGVLELLQRLSSKRHGLLRISDSDSNVESYVLRLSSTLAILIIATLVNSLDFTIMTFAPYSRLRQGNAPADRSILLHLLSESPSLIFIKSIRAQHFGPAASNVSLLHSVWLAGCD